ncbi:superoxide dismutase [Cladorrhinum sp. PSN259]|nr:superoxide dismutase [Cladorrhinum sp. PSN259]
MRVTESLSLLIAAAGTQVLAQTSTSTVSAAPTATGLPDTGKLGNATVVTNNPVGVVYKATLPEKAFFPFAYPEGGNIQGEVSAVAAEGGTGVVFTVKLSNLPKVAGIDSFPYHLHVLPAAGGNCTATLAHLDPFERGEATACNPDLPETCQTGDLSGKHGAIKPDAEGKFEATYTDLYSSTLEGLGSFFGNRSVVFHFPNKTRITCADFAKVEGGAVLPTSNATVPLPTGGAPTSSVPSPSGSSTGAPISGAGVNGVKAAGLMGAVAGIAVMALL